MNYQSLKKDHVHMCPNLGLVTDAAKTNDDSMLVQPAFDVIIPTRGINPFYFLKDELEADYKNNIIPETNYYSYDVESVNRIEDILISNILQNLTIILNTGMWSECLNYVIPAMGDEAYKIFYNQSSKLRDIICCEISDTTRDIKRSELTAINTRGRVLGLKNQLLADIAINCNNTLLDIINRGCIDVAKANEYANKMINLKSPCISDTYNEYKNDDPSFFIYIINGCITGDLERMNDILDIALSNYISSLNNSK